MRSIFLHWLMRLVWLHKWLMWKMVCFYRVLWCLIIWVCDDEFLIPFANSKRNLATTIPELSTLLAEVVCLKHFFFRKLSVFGSCVIYESMGAILSVCFCLLHPNRPDLTVLREDWFEKGLVRQLWVHLESNKQSCTVLRSQIIPRDVTQNCRCSFAGVWKLNFYFASPNLKSLC